MKKLFIFTLFLSSISVYAQDVITLRSGEQIKAKVTEISSSELRYKRFEHLDGPTRVVSLADVFAINYEDGTREVFNAEKSRATTQISKQSSPKAPKAPKASKTKKTEQQELPKALPAETSNRNKEIVIQSVVVPSDSIKNEYCLNIQMKNQGYLIPPKIEIFLNGAQISTIQGGENQHHHLSEGNQTILFKHNLSERKFEIDIKQDFTIQLGFQIKKGIIDVEISANSFEEKK